MYVGSQVIMKQYDQCLLDQGYSIEELIDKASDCLFKYFNNYQSIALICGVGNNGADGLSLALKLHKVNKNVDVFIFDDEYISEGNKYYLELCYKNDVNIILLDENCIDSMYNILQDKDVIVDGMFGFGLNSSPRGLYQIVIEMINQFYDKEIIAIDIPTGLNVNTGIPYNKAVCATKTITLTALKSGFLNPDSYSFTGKVFVERLDIECDEADELLYKMFDSFDGNKLLKERLFNGHKYYYGRVGIIAGSPKYKGAALLASKSAVYSGSGLVTLMSDEEVLKQLTLFVPEAISQVIPSIFNEEDLNCYDSILIGSGLSTDINSERYINDVLKLYHKHLIIDGDGLNVLSKNLNLLHETSAKVILTPHLGEFKRLYPFDEHDDLLYIAKEFAKKYQIVLVLKGPYTIVTDGTDSYRVIAGNRAMASAGMGDVLAGIITSLAGQNYNLKESALLGVLIHGLCGDTIAKSAYTVIPSKVIDVIPTIMYKIKNNLL